MLGLVSILIIDRLILLWSFARVVYVASLLRKWLSNLPASSNLADSVWQKEFLLFFGSIPKGPLGLVGLNTLRQLCIGRSMARTSALQADDGVSITLRCSL